MRKSNIRLSSAASSKKGLKLTAGEKHEGSEQLGQAPQSIDYDAIL